MSTLHPDHRRPILALDFDGVLHTTGADDADLFARLPLLTAALRHSLVHVDVLISSDWRLEFDVDTLRQRFPPDLRARVLGVTPYPDQVSPPRWGHWVTQYPRQAEITAWIHHRFGSLNHPWAALDDRPEGFLPGDNRVVPVVGSQGLQPEQLVQVANILRYPV